VEPRSFVQKLVKEYRETQNIAPRTERCGVNLKLNAKQLLILAELIDGVTSRLKARLGQGFELSDQAKGSSLA